MEWTDRKVKLLREMAREGRSFSEAGQVLGCSRNAVAGKAKRLKVKFRSKSEGEKLSQAVRLAWGRMPPEVRVARIAGGANKAAAAAKAKRQARA